MMFIALFLSNRMTETQIIKLSKKWLLVGSIIGAAIRAVIEVVQKYVI